MEAHGINSTAHYWLKYYLSNRNQPVCIGGQLSAPAPVTIGVLQCSILGPLAFILFIYLKMPSTLKFICMSMMLLFSLALATLIP